MNASLEGGQLMIEVLTIEPLPEDEIEDLQFDLQGPEVCLKASEDEEGASKLVPDIQVNALPETEDNFFGIRYEACIDQRFLALFELALEAGMSETKAYEIASATTALFRIEFGREQGEFSIAEGVAEEAPVPEDQDWESAGRVRFQVLPVDGLDEGAVSGQIFAEMFEGLTNSLNETTAERVEGGYEVSLLMNTSSKDADLPYEEVRPRMSQATAQDPVKTALLMVSFRKLAETVAAPPLNITVPRHELVVDYDEREYEYFFSSQLLMIATDILGLGVIGLLLYLEGRGTLRRYGAEEDKAR
jgi:hypothetical protein